MAIDLYQVCNELLKELESKTKNVPIGCCYLLGHCLAEGFIQAGLKATETTGVLILLDKNKKSLVYGSSAYKGKLVGYYHTWCVLDSGIIVDPSIKYEKFWLKRDLNIKLNPQMPDCLISSESKTWYYNYIEDSSFTPQSKSFLKQTPSELLKKLIDKVAESAK